MDYRDAYNEWLTCFADDAELVRELKSLPDGSEKEDRFYTDLSFGTAGMRGVLGMGTNRMNRYVVRRASAGLADYILRVPYQAERGVVVAYDSRRNSALFARETALTLCAMGVRAYLFDALRPVPVLSYAVRHLHAIAGVVITASHNAPQYNGYKVYWKDGAQLSPEAALEVTACIRARTYAECLPMDEKEAAQKGLFSVIGNAEVDDDYIAMVKKLCVCPDLLAAEGGKLRIVYTPLHGSGNIPVRRILEAVGVSHVMVVPEQELPDPDFPTVKSPNPEDPAAFRLAVPLADKVGADVIFGTDPDCDRLGVAVRDGEGKFITLTGNQIGCLLLYHILSSRKKAGTLPRDGAVCKSVVSTELARAICRDFQVDCFDTLTGFKFIGEKIHLFRKEESHSFLFGFEESYGFLSGTDVRDKDGVNASMLIAEAACVCMHEGITLYERLRMIYEKYGYYCERVVSKTLPGRDGIEKMQAIMRKLREEPPAAFGSLRVCAVRDFLSGLRTQEGESRDMGFPKSDVLYYEMDGGHWLCIRPSGTEPKIKLYVSTVSRQSDQADALNNALQKSAESLLNV